MSGDVLSDEDRAYRILGDRRSARVIIEDDQWTLLQVATSALEPGFVAIQYFGCDPVLLTDTKASDLSAFLAEAAGGVTSFPETPRPCNECGAVWHIPDLCESAEWDPTENAGGPR